MSSRKRSPEFRRKSAEYTLKQGDVLKKNVRTHSEKRNCPVPSTAPLHLPLCGLLNTLSERGVRLSKETLSNSIMSYCSFSRRDRSLFSAPGARLSSLSRKSMYLPFALSRPVFRAFAAPPWFWRTGKKPAKRSAYSWRIAAEPSEEPSSTAIISVSESPGRHSGSRHSRR